MVSKSCETIHSPAEQAPEHGIELVVHAVSRSISHLATIQSLDHS